MDDTDPTYEARLGPWRTFLKGAFGLGVPDQAQWTDRTAIGGVLRAVVDVPHCLVRPGGHRAELAGVRLLEGPQILLQVDDLAYHVMPTALTFEGFEDPGLSYLRLDVFDDDPYDLSLAANLRLCAPGAWLVFSLASPFLRSTLASDPSALGGDDLRDAVLSLQDHLLMRTVDQD